MGTDNKDTLEPESDALFEDSVYGELHRYIADLGRGVVDEEKAEISSTELSR